MEGRQITAFDPAPILQEAKDLVRNLRARNATLHGLAADLAAALP